MSVVKVGSDYIYWLARETTFGTAVTADAIQVPTENIDFDHDIKTHIIPRANGFRADSENDVWTDTVGSIPKATATFMVTPETAEFMPAFFQYNGTYNTSDVITYKTYTSCTGTPDFSDNEGYFYTLRADKCGGDADSEEMTGTIAQSLTLSIGPDDNEGTLYASMDFVAQESSVAETGIGSDNVTFPSPADRYTWDEIDIFTVSALSLVSSLYTFEITGNNGAKMVPAGGRGQAAIPRWEVTGSFQILGSDANAETLKDLVEDQEPGDGMALALRWGDAVPLAQGDLGIESSIKLTGYSLDKSEEELITFEFKGIGTEPLVVKFFKD